MRTLVAAAVSGVLLVSPVAPQPSVHRVDKRVTKLERRVKDQRADINRLLLAVTDALVLAGQANITATGLHAELGCIKFRNVTDHGEALDRTDPGEISDDRMAVIDGRCSSWTPARQ